MNMDLQIRIQGVVRRGEVEDVPTLQRMLKSLWASHMKMLERLRRSRRQLADARAEIAELKRRYERQS